MSGIMLSAGPRDRLSSYSYLCVFLGWQGWQGWANIHRAEDAADGVEEGGKSCGSRATAAAVELSLSLSGEGLSRVGRQGCKQGCPLLCKRNPRSAGPNRCSDPQASDPCCRSHVT